VFAVDRTSDARSVAGRSRFVERPAGVVLVGDRGGEGSPAGPRAIEHAAIRFRARDKSIGLVVLAVFGALWGAAIAWYQLVLRPSLGTPPTTDDASFWLGPSVVLILGAPLAALIGLWRNTFSVRVGGDFVVAKRGWRERFRMKRGVITQIACFSEIIRAGEGVRTRCDLVALDARGVRTPMLEDVPPTHALFAEVWLEDVLGLADLPVDREFI
jgi:hypothetical protein